MLNRINDIAIRNGLETGHVSVIRRKNNVGAAGVKDGETTTNFARIAAAGWNVDVSAGSRTNKKLPIRPQFHPMVVAIGDYSGPCDRHCAQIDDIYHAASRCRSTGPAGGPGRRSRHIQSAATQKANCGGIHRDATSRSVRIQVEHSYAGRDASAFRTAIEDVCSGVITAKNTPDRMIESRTLDGGARIRVGADQARGNHRNRVGVVPKYKDTITIVASDDGACS